MKKGLDQDYLKTLFLYDPETGDLIWKERPLSHFATKNAQGVINSKCAGKVAGYKSFLKNGDPCTIQVRFDTKLYKAHRIVWILLVGPIPPEMIIDHIDGNPFNNKLSNLRLATVSQNAMNRGPQKNNTSGYKGVFFFKRDKSWQAQITISGKRKHLGYFDTPELAYSAYLSAEKVLYGDFARKRNALN